MVWIHHVLFGALTMGQVDTSTGTHGRESPSPTKPPAVAFLDMPGLSIPNVDPIREAQPSSAPLANPGVETLPPLVVPGQANNRPELAEPARPKAETRGVEMLPPARLTSPPEAPHVWGFSGGNFYYGGTRMAPNGLSYFPLATGDLDLNIGLLPDKKLYIFVTTDFWLQRATAYQSHGSFDFTKREYDVDVGLAWNYWGAFELRAFGFALNNLNRGTSTLLPSGYNDGGGVENRYYFPTDDIYDIPRQSFLSIGYLPGKSVTGGDGVTFTPGLFARSYLSRDLHVFHSYVYADASLMCESDLGARLLTMDVGIAARPFTVMENLEFRLGATDTYDVKPAVNRGMGYLGIRFIF